MSRHVLKSRGPYPVVRRMEVVRHLFRRPDRFFENLQGPYVASFGSCNTAKTQC